RFSNIKGKIIRRKEEEIVKKIFDEFNERMNILDIPCGTGRFSYILKEYSTEITGADLSQRMLDYSRKSGNYSRLLKCEIENLPFSDREFDVLFCFRLFHHLPGEVRAKALREISRVTKKYFIFSFYNRYSISGFIKKIILQRSFYTMTQEQMKNEIPQEFKLVKVFKLLPLVAGETVFVCEKNK
ncbi:class I SAM-dependent methyltransferase, partial [Elusimicrobiota bacterium]